MKQKYVVLEKDVVAETLSTEEIEVLDSLILKVRMHEGPRKYEVKDINGGSNQ